MPNDLSSINSDRDNGSIIEIKKFKLNKKVAKIKTEEIKIVKEFE